VAEGEILAQATPSPLAVMYARHNNHKPLVFSLSWEMLASSTLPEKTKS